MNNYIAFIKNSLEKSLGVSIYCRTHEIDDYKAVEMSLSQEEGKDIKEKIKQDIEEMKEKNASRVVNFDNEFFYILKANKEDNWTEVEAFNDCLEIIDMIKIVN